MLFYSLIVGTYTHVNLMPEPAPTESSVANHIAVGDSGAERVDNTRMSSKTPSTSKMSRFATFSNVTSGDIGPYPSRIWHDVEGVFEDKHVVN